MQRKHKKFVPPNTPMLHDVLSAWPRKDKDRLHTHFIPKRLNRRNNRSHKCDSITSQSHKMCEIEPMISEQMRKRVFSVN